jgi:hypothetical protein
MTLPKKKQGHLSEIYFQKLCGILFILALDNMKQKKHLKIELPNPCHEDWTQMSKAEKGRFCGSCEKIVVDFTTKTDKELIEFFVTKNQRACGRFRTNQLDRAIVPEQEVTTKWWPNAIAAGILSVLSFAGFSQEPKPGKAEIIIEHEIELEYEHEITMGEAPLNDITIANFKGSVLDQDGNRIGYAKIKIHDFDTTIVSDEDGRFEVSLDLKGKDIQTHFNAKLSASGYYEMDIQLPAFGEEMEYIMTNGATIEVPERRHYRQLGGVPKIQITDIQPLLRDDCLEKKTKRKFWFW